MNKASALNQNFYQDKRIFITGHTGFKGAWLTQIACELQALVCGYALPPENGCLFEKTAVAQDIIHVEGDVCDAEHLKRALCDFKPDIVMHLAAQAIVKDCFEDPHRAYSTNVMGTVNLFEAIRACESVKSVLVVTTDKVYENKGDGAVYKVGDPLGGVDPYSASKTCMEFVTNAYKCSYLQTAKRTVGIATVRASNVIAGGDHVQSRLIPSILNGFANNKPVELRNPNQTRPWQSVLDAMNGYLTVARKLYEQPLSYSDAWNIGPTNEGICPVGQVFEKMQGFFDSTVDFVSVERLSVKESATLGLDASQSMERLDWQPEQPLDRILFELTDYFKRQQNGEDERSICKRQIREFFEMR